MMLGFQSRDKWSLNNYETIEIKNRGFYASSVTIPYVEDITSTLKLRSASWLVWVVFLAMRKVTALSVGFPIQTRWLWKPRKELSITHHREELLTISPLNIGSKNDLSKNNYC